MTAFEKQPNQPLRVSQVVWRKPNSAYSNEAYQLHLSRHVTWHVTWYLSRHVTWQFTLSEINVKALLKFS